MTIRLDVSAESIVIVCTMCHYRAVDGDRATAWERGAAHIRRVHGDDMPALTAAKQNLKRHHRRDVG